jgi:hypothetical protein
MNKNAKDFQGGTGREQGTRFVFEERVDLELRSGLLAPVHPLGGINGSSGMTGKFEQYHDNS